MSDSLAHVLAVDRGVRARGAQRVIELPEGIVVRHDELPVLRHLNALLLDAPLPETLAQAPALAEFADRHLAGLGHRQVVLDDATAAEALAPALLDVGWIRQRVLFMVLSGEPDHPPRPGLARRLDDLETHELQHAVTAEELPPEESASGAVAAAIVRQLVAGQEAMRAGTRSICFGAGEDRRLASICTLFLDDDGSAMIEEVGTLTADRGRGLARAVVSAAIDAAVQEGCDPIFVPADADDWPQLLYTRLGFEPVGMQVSFTLREAGR